MSEVLRGLLEAKCAYSQVAFYTLPFLQTLGGGARTLGRRQVTIPCKADCYFLAMGALQAAALIGPGAVGWSNKATATTFLLKRGSNLDQFSFTPQIKSNQNYNLNNFASWSEYVLFQPSELLTVVEDIVTNDGAAAGLNVINYVMIQGVEYFMPSARPGESHGL